jgi:Matrixin
MPNLKRSDQRSIRSSLLTSGALALALTLLAAVPAGAAAPAARVPTITRGGLTVAIPARGMGVVASALTVSGANRELRVETRADGQVVVLSDPDSAAVAQRSATRSQMVAPAGSPPACSDTKRKVFASWWHSTFHWSFKTASKPSNLTVSTATAELKRAVKNITGERNDCGRPDHVSATSTYDGSTTRSPQIGSDASCTGTDNHNTVAFGDLPGSVLAYTCWWYIGNQTMEADMRINKADFHWAVTPSSCSNAYILQGVATHEFGHVYGLGHVSQTGHANETMSTQIYTCDASDETLGLGDMLGLETHY